jgi:hypothetical protein
MPSTAGAGFVGTLVLGYYDREKLVYAGRVGMVDGAFADIRSQYGVCNVGAAGTSTLIEERVRSFALPNRPT